jgi:hypothetical protein
MTIKEVIETNEKIKNYTEDGRLVIKPASEINEEDEFADFDDEYLVHEEKMKLFRTMRASIELHAEIERRLDRLISLFENLQNQVDSIKISD